MRCGPDEVKGIIAGALAAPPQRNSKVIGRCRKEMKARNQKSHGGFCCLRGPARPRGARHPDKDALGVGVGGGGGGGGGGWGGGGGGAGWGGVGVGGGGGGGGGWGGGGGGGGVGWGGGGWVGRYKFAAKQRPGTGPRPRRQSCRK